MYIILGATGHIGSAVTGHLLQQRENVTIITRRPENKTMWEQKGAKVAIVDVMDTDKLKQVFQTGERLFLLNPPGAPTEDMEQQENSTLDSILEALRAATSIRKVVAQSTYGAQRGTGIGDLGVLYRMEQKLAALPSSVTILRGAYYMSNWDMFVETARQDGKIYSLFPTDFKLPMVSPKDIGKLAASLLTQPEESKGLHFIEGPEWYSPGDVAAAFSDVLQKPVDAVEIPPSGWKEYLLSFGFSPASASSLMTMTRITMADDFKTAEPPHRGTTTIREHVEQLVNG